MWLIFMFKCLISCFAIYMCNHIQSPLFIIEDLHMYLTSLLASARFTARPSLPFVWIGESPFCGRSERVGEFVPPHPLCIMLPSEWKYISTSGQTSGVVHIISCLLCTYNRIGSYSIPSEKTQEALFFNFSGL